jgi:hypothetical protein
MKAGIKFFIFNRSRRRLELIRFIIIFLIFVLWLKNFNTISIENLFSFFSVLLRKG